MSEQGAIEPKRRVVLVVAEAGITIRGTDSTYWQGQTVEARLQALEDIRREYHRQQGIPEGPIERVVRIVKQPKIPGGEPD